MKTASHKDPARIVFGEVGEHSRRYTATRWNVARLERWFGPGELGCAHWPPGLYNGRSMGRWYEWQAREVRG